MVSLIDLRVNKIGSQDVLPTTLGIRNGATERRLSITVTRRPRSASGHAERGSIGDRRNGRKGDGDISVPRLLEHHVALLYGAIHSQDSEEHCWGDERSSCTILSSTHTCGEKDSDRTLSRQDQQRHLQRSSGKIVACNFILHPQNRLNAYIISISFDDRAITLAPLA